MTVKKMCVAACFVVVFLPMVLGGCASQGKSGSDSANDGAELTAWSLETDCSVCHAVESASADDSACLYNLHSDTACGTCHNSTKLETLHAKASEEVPSELRATSVGSDSCLSCHDRNDLARKTAGSAALTDKNGKVVNPHDLPAVVDHEKIECSSCHTMHAPAAEDVLQKRAADKCTGCHHAEVYECGTCH